MLNRRLLRTKAVQALYAGRLAAESNRLIALDEIAEAYKPDLNSMEVQNLEKLEGQRKLAALTLDELIETGRPATDTAVPFEVIQVARRVYNGYVKATELDYKNALKRVLKDTEEIYDEFLEVLALITELAKQARLDRERKYDDPDHPMPKESGLDTNVIATMLQEHEPFQTELIRRGINWHPEINLVRKAYREVLRTDDTYREYCRQNVHTIEEDREMVQYLLRSVILKNEIFLEYFSKKDLYWEDHSELIRSMAIKTLKSESKTGRLELAAFTDDWTDDRGFVEELVTRTRENSTLYDTYLHDQLQNWDLERVALMDIIIMKAALTELINFRNIPVKVTINEFIETAKRYSTPKSGKFVNGVLDVLSVRLREEGVIRKSGRGLIDNK